MPVSVLFSVIAGEGFPHAPPCAFDLLSEVIRVQCACRGLKRWTVFLLQRLQTHVHLTLDPVHLGPMEAVSEAGNGQSQRRAIGDGYCGGEMIGLLPCASDRSLGGSAIPTPGRKRR